MKSAELLTTDQAAEIIGIAPDSVRWAIRRGYITTQRFGRDYLIERAEAERYRDNPRLAGRGRKPSVPTPEWRAASERAREHVG